MADIHDLNEPWNGHTYAEVSTFIKGELTILSGSLEQVIPEAPADGKQYARQDKEWSEVAAVTAWESGSGPQSIQLSQSVAEGDRSIAVGFKSRAEGNQSIAAGCRVTASGQYSHAEGSQSIASGKASHAEGFKSNAVGDYSHAEGAYGIANGYGCHVEGYANTASANYSHAEGYKVQALMNYSHAEGYQTIASGVYAHAEGRGSEATENYAHAEGFYTRAINRTAHAEGSGSVAQGTGSHAEGCNTIALGHYSHAEGLYNAPNSGSDDSEISIYTLGIGTDDSNRKNALEVMQNGDVYMYGVGKYNGTNATESAVRLQDILSYPTIPEGYPASPKTGMMCIVGDKILVYLAGSWVSISYAEFVEEEEPVEEPEEEE